MRTILFVQQIRRIAHPVRRIQTGMKAKKRMSLPTSSLQRHSAASRSPLPDVHEVVLLGGFDDDADPQLAVVLRDVVPAFLELLLRQVAVAAEGQAGIAEAAVLVLDVVLAQDGRNDRRTAHAVFKSS